MPYSLVLNLIPRSLLPKTNLSGRHLHALFLELVDSVDPELAISLHQQSADKAVRSIHHGGDSLLVAGGFVR
jgi:CRISPR-associated endoribonuclease Cas6